MRRACILLVACASLFGTATAATAGGSPLTVPGGNRLRSPGEAVSFSAAFWRGSQAPVSDGPWFATIRTLDGKRRGTPLVPITVTAGDNHWFATGTVTLPDLPTDRYEIAVTNAQGEGVGDLMGAILRVAPSPAAWRVHVLQERRRQLIQQSQDQEEVAQAALQRVMAANTRLEEERDALVTRAEKAGAALEAARVEGANARPLVPGWAAIIVSLLIVGWFTILARKRRGGRRMVALPTVSESDRAA